MGKTSSVIRQKMEKNKRIAMREKWDKSADRAMGEPHLRKDYQYHEKFAPVLDNVVRMGSITVYDSTGIEDESRRVWIDEHAPVRRGAIVKKYGKRFWGVYGTTGLIRLFPSDARAEALAYASKI